MRVLHILRLAWEQRVQKIFKKLYDQGVITEQQYDEVCKIIYEKINRCSKEVKNC